MGEVVRGSEAVAAGILTRGELRWNYRSIYPDVYVPNGSVPSLRTRTIGAWLWSRRRGVITGQAAAALHGAKWIDDAVPVEVLCANNRVPKGMTARRDRIGPDEICDVGGVAVATPARTGLDLGRYLPRTAAVIHLDALAAATAVTQPDVLGLAARYCGARGVRKSRVAALLMDRGAQSPKETWLRLLLVDAGFPRPQTQIPLVDGYGRAFAYLDMGWADVMIAVEYDGDHHRSSRAQYAWDVKRLRMVTNLGWLHVRVIAEDSPYDIVDRVRRAWTQREREVMAVNRLPPRP